MLRECCNLSEHVPGCFTGFRKRSLYTGNLLKHVYNVTRSVNIRRESLTRDYINRNSSQSITFSLQFRLHGSLCDEQKEISGKRARRLTFIRRYEDFLLICCGCVIRSNEKFLCSSLLLTPDNLSDSATDTELKARNDHARSLDKCAGKERSQE